VKGLSPEQANTLIKAHLWLSQSISFITIKLHTYSPTSYVTALKDMAVNLDKASKVITAVTIQMTTPKKLIHDTLKELGVLQQRIALMVNGCQAIPRGHTLNLKETPKNIKEKKKLTSNSSIATWEIHIPPPFDSIQDTNPRMQTKHDIWIKSFSNSNMVFQSLKSAKGSAINHN